MGKAGSFGKQQKASTPPADDIPEALRENTQVKVRSKNRLVFLLIGIGGLGVALIASLWYTNVLPPIKLGANPTPTISVNPTPINPISSPISSPDMILGHAGHFAYSEAPLNNLQPIVTDGRISLRRAAAKQFIAMVEAAQASGVFLAPISGFRSIKDQQSIFFTVKNERKQTVSERAEVSAPPGYSEHHTGYAVDIGDGAVPATNLNPNFDQTKAFKWLSANASRFNFEMSFPKHNLQGVSYEPWHWRFVGDRDSLETFYRAKKLKPQEG